MLACSLLPFGTAAQEAPFPSRPITMLVGFAPGGGTDILARLIAPKLSEELGQPVAVENRTGGGGTIAVVAAARARPDGHTVTLGTLSNNVQVPLAMRNPPFDPQRDVTPLAQVASVPLVMVVPATSPARSVAEFVALAKAQPGVLNHASNGVGTSQHMAAALFMLGTGTQLTHVPYRGSGPATIDLTAGVVNVNFDTLSTVLPHIRQNRLRALAVTTRARSDQLPEVPTMIESGLPEYDIDLWYMLFGPAGLPEGVAQRWAQAVNAAFADPAFRAKLVESGFGPAGGSPGQAATVLNADIARYREVIRRADIRLE
ncbi:tripartite tricarboxylate transporter substrate binding protein [Siccirubricoccus sp. KC 17139]|uniref:Tripartite tricarboxylate transporter substrate binding protein n=1 Tax=Siccirubricoccus soli TaxID=2899147 RepID=A0ABT1DA29_9PROT|nr:tripartite tricarboxylate transporter substrate binding protein [Siccirubricoccus soli]MCO6418798.1 tripartite tricarboxylate transporter substrate binding protein [Siccirubricoccus soli]MCP2684933.1 tripartite tricarboxylate transporter substrate binding protein [Siccirubricoccus soli]